MNCLEFRRALGADPNTRSPESLAHRAECPTCEKYGQEMMRLNGLIKKALEVPVREGRPINTAPKMRWYALAASVMLVVGIATTAWLIGYPQPALARDVVQHLNHEPGSRAITDSRVAADQLEAGLKAKGYRLTQPVTDISYFQSCPFRKQFVPHLVVQTQGGPVTVMLLPNEKISREQKFQEQAFHGMLVPMENGGMAVLAEDAALIEAVAQRIKSAVVRE